RKTAASCSFRVNSELRVRLIGSREASMNTSRCSSISLLLAGAAAVIGACSHRADDCAENLTCGPAALNSARNSRADSGGNTSGGEAGTHGDAGTGTGGESGNNSAQCDTSKSPGDEVCLIDATYGVYVSAAGDAKKGDGSAAKPFATIGQALAAAKLA